jgi:SpoIID/LytB domain protein
MRNPLPRRCLATLATVGTTATAAVAFLASAPTAIAWPTSDVVITGHGFGHGRGMGQWGAYGYATSYSWNYQQILSHYYGGTILATDPASTMTVDLSALDGSGSVVVTAAKPFNAGGVAIPAGGAVRLSLVNGHYELGISAGCGKPRQSTKTSGVTGVITPPTSIVNPDDLLTICYDGGGGTRGYRGSLSLVLGSGITRVVNTVPTELYLQGVVPRESPASWGDAAGGKGLEALKAQAVAARTYASRSARYSWAKICDNQNCQVYGGAVLNGLIIEDSRTNAATSATAGKVLKNSSSQLVSAEFSSSSGGWTAGGTFPAVEDLGDAASPYHNWSVTIPASTVGDAFGVGSLRSISTSRNGLGADGGRVLSAVVTGSAGSVTVTGDQFRSALGLRSDWFTVANPAPVVPTISYSNSLSAPSADIMQAFGRPKDIPIACDFNGDHTDTGGVYRPSEGMFYLRDGFTAQSPLRLVKLGGPGDQPVCGDWNGDGVATLGVYRSSTSTFYLLNTNARTSSTPLIQFKMGNPGDIPIAGDWDGDGRDTVGLRRPSTATFYLINQNSTTAPRLAYRMGIASDRPVAGDWNGDGKDTYGVFSAGRKFWLTNALGGAPSIAVTWGQPGDLPLGGDWNNDGTDTVGLGRGYTTF